MPNADDYLDTKAANCLASLEHHHYKLKFKKNE